MPPPLFIPTRQAFNWEECLWYLDREFDDIMYRVYPGKVRRALNFNDEDLLVEVTYNGEALQIEFLLGQPDEAAVMFVKNFITDWFDPDRDLNLFYTRLAAHQKLAYMSTAYNGLRFVGIPDLFEALLWTIMGQQINLTFAYKIKRKLVETYGSKVHLKARVSGSSRRPM